jgi:hypothetical protein
LSRHRRLGHGFDQDARTERLGHDVLESRRDQSFDRGVVSVGRERQDRRRGVRALGCAYPAQGPRAVQPGHAHVHQDEVVGPLTGALHGLFPIHGFRDLDTGSGQEQPRQFAIGAMVVDHQDAETGKVQQLVGRGRVVGLRRTGQRRGES